MADLGLQSTQFRRTSFSDEAKNCSGFAQIGLGMVSLEVELRMMKPKNSEREGRKRQATSGGAAGAGATAVPELDWLALAITSGCVWTVYLLTWPRTDTRRLGELVTGRVLCWDSAPAPLPVWTIYSWIWTALLPIGNMAWRVSVGQAFFRGGGLRLARADGARGQQHAYGGHRELKGMTGNGKRPFAVSAVSPLLLGLDGFMWRESCVVNRIAVTSVPWYLTVLVCPLRWIRHQLRYANWPPFSSAFASPPPSLIVAALASRSPLPRAIRAWGRDAFLGQLHNP